MDLYSQRLSHHLGVPVVQSDIYQKTAELFNIPLTSRRAVKALWLDYRFLRTVNRLGSIVQLPNHHLGRYGNFLKVPFIITVHDLIRFFDLKGYGPLIHRPNLRDRLYLSLDYRGIRKAVKIIASSHHTKNDLVDHLKIPEETIVVVHLGVDTNIFTPSNGPRPVDSPYILFVGAEQPRKNLKTLLKAFAELKKQRRFKDLTLVKVGSAGGREADFRSQTLEVIGTLGLEADVVFTGFVAEEELPLYYSNAGCCVLPSLYEGFGFPPLEAMACGCPVVTSNASSLPEIVGEAALKVEPRDVNGLAEALGQLLTDNQLRKSLIQRGFQRANHFSWEKTARETLKVYRQVEAELS